MTKLLIVDVQADFCEGGALPCEGGWRTARRITNYLAGHVANLPVYTEVIASRDFHRPDDDNGGHFSDDPDYVDTWPPHCVAATDGADYAFDNEARLPITHIVKGFGEPAYSALEGDRALDPDPDSSRWAPDIREDYHVCGIATDYCVKQTVLDLLKAGARVTVLKDLCVGVTREGHEAALLEMQDAGANLR